jgi:hypothetical protein
MLGFVREMRAAVFHLRDARVGVVRMPPLDVAAFLRALSIEPRQIGPRRRLDARSLRQSRQKLVLRLPRIASHDAAQGRVRLHVVASTPMVFPLMRAAVART